MKKYKRILVTTDFSDINRLAVQRAADLAQQSSCELILLHVIEHFPYDSGPLGSVFPETINPDHILVQRANDKLRAIVGELGIEHAQLEVSVTAKSARREILRFAEAGGVDMIVVAPHGRGLIGTLGSTAMGVVNGATCDVLTVRE
jgi:universal stress protein A